MSTEHSSVLTHPCSVCRVRLADLIIALILRIPVMHPVVNVGYCNSEPVKCYNLSNAQAANKAIGHADLLLHANTQMNSLMQ